MVTATLLAALIAASAGGADGVRRTASDPPVVHVYVRVQSGGLPPEEPRSDVTDLKGSVTDLEQALKSRKKTFAVVDAPDQADLTLDVVSRSTTVPRVVITPAVPIGQPGYQDVVTPTRILHLRVSAVFRGTTLEFTNKNQPLDRGGGWKAAAEDVAKQLEKWVRQPPGR